MSPTVTGSACARLGRDGRRVGEAADGGLLELELRERAQEAVGHEHVDARLRVGVDPARDPERDRGIERGDLDLDVQPRAPGLRLGAAGQVDLEVAVALVALRGDEDPVADAPADHAALVVHRVLGRAEAQQHERSRDQHDVALGRRVGDADQAERHAREVLPVRAREPLQVHRRPDRVELARRHREVRGLDRAHRAALVERGVLLGVADDRVGDVALAGAVQQPHRRPDDVTRGVSRCARRRCGP